MSTILQMTVNFAALSQSLVGAVVVALRHVAIGLHAASLAGEARLAISEAQSSLPTLQLWPPDDEAQLREEFERWIVLMAFRDCLEQVAGFLQHAYNLCLVVGHGPQPPPLAELQREWAEEGSKFNSLSFPAKFDRLRAFGVESAAEKHVLAMNHVRNCLVHRGGIVGADDCRKAGALRVSWFRFDLIAVAADGTERPVIPPMEVAAGGSVIARQTVEQREFKLGERVRLSKGDLLCMFWTLMPFAKDIAESAERFAASKGLAPAPPLTSTEQPVAGTDEKGA